ncbi:hypothetical protein CISG_10168 [Coccidioides immitis RMSCC 3703]|uniref:Uncharacterized protein n=1 Tax=Coccidioides immitis RMSCC 3703 TaxID=454286 RepID=A0A0J8QRB7_COCIT|nr:hypothetical protein CISG_10168 [Coccidioides immitis RMSCC 3703]
MKLSTTSSDGGLILSGTRTRAGDPMARHKGGLAAGIQQPDCLVFAIPGEAAQTRKFCFFASRDEDGRAGERLLPSNLSTTVRSGLSRHRQQQATTMLLDKGKKRGGRISDVRIIPICPIAAVGEGRLCYLIGHISLRCANILFQAPF